MAFADLNFQGSQSKITIDISPTFQNWTFGVSLLKYIIQLLQDKQESKAK